MPATGVSSTPAPGGATILPASSPLTKTCRAVQELWKQSCEGLDYHQRQELKKLLDDNADLYATNDEDWLALAKW